MSLRLGRGLPMLCTMVLLVIGMSPPAFASSSFSQVNTLTGYQKRQITGAPALTAPSPTASTSTSSFDYWWPYPPASAITPEPTFEQDGTDPVISTPEDTMSSATDALSSPISMSVTPSASPSSTGLTSTSVSSSNSSQDDMGSTSLPITITALPPMTSPFRHPHAISAYHKPVNTIVFVPLLGILGIAIGAASGWYGYGHWKRWWKTREDNCLAGPRYEGVKGDDEGEKTFEDEEKYTCGDFVEMGHGEEVAEPFHLNKTALQLDKPEMPNQPVEPKSGSLWSWVSLSSVLHSPLLPGVVTGRAGIGGKFRDNSKNQLSFSPLPNLEERLDAVVLSPEAPTVFSSVATSDEDDEDYDDARRLIDRRVNVRHKSIRKRLAEKLRLQFSPGRGLGRQKSKKGGKKRGKTPELEEGVLLQDEYSFVNSPPAFEKGSIKRNKPRPPSSVLGHGRAISDFTIPTNQIQTPPRVYALKDPGVVRTSSSAQYSARMYSSPLKTGNEADCEDRFTPLPARKVRTPRRLVSERTLRTRQEMLKDDLDELPKFIATEDRRVLPTSPPLLSSPKLDSDLFFSSNADPAKDYSDLRSPTHQVTARRNSLRSEHASPARGSPLRSDTAGLRRSNKLLSKHSATHIQLRDKALPNSPPRRTQTRSSSVSPRKVILGPRDMRQGRDRSNTLAAASIPMSPKERYEARRAALDKVDAIIERSWSARLLQGVAPSSPTMFGACVDRSRDGHEMSSRMPGTGQIFRSP